MGLAWYLPHGIDRIPDKIHQNANEAWTLPEYLRQPFDIPETLEPPSDPIPSDEAPRASSMTVPN